MQHYGCADVHYINNGHYLNCKVAGEPVYVKWLFVDLKLNFIDCIATKNLIIVKVYFFSVPIIAQVTKIIVAN